MQEEQNELPVLLLNPALQMRSVRFKMQAVLTSKLQTVNFEAYRYPLNKALD